MLNFFFLSKKGKLFIKNNYYIDFIYKRVLIKIINVVFIRMGFFFSEKFIVENLFKFNTLTHLFEFGFRGGVFP